MRYKTLLVSIFLSLFQLLFCTFLLNAQNWDYLLKSLDEKDKGIVEKAIVSLKEAGELTKLSNEYYNNALELQSNYDLDEETLQKKLSKEESRAISTQLKADKIYAESNKKIIDVCRSVLLNKNSDNPGSSESVKTADGFVDQANQKRTEANNTKNVYEKATLLNDASGLETAAIENLISAIASSNGEVVVEGQEQSNQQVEEVVKEEILLNSKDTLVYANNNTLVPGANVAINQQNVGKYNSYSSDAAVPEPILVSRMGISGVDSVDMESLKQYYQDYYSSETGLSAEAIKEVPAIIPAEPVITAASETGPEVAVQMNQTPESTDVPKTKKKTKKDTKTSSTGDEFDFSQIQQNSDVRFMVQLAASKVPLSKVQIQAIYPGNFIVEIMEEEDWFKYRITGFRLFSQANIVALNSGVESAYVISILNENQIPLPKARQMTKEKEEATGKNKNSSIAGMIDYFIQIKATRVQLTGSAFDDIYSKYPSTRVILEGGWFKYQFYLGTSYKEVLEQQQNLPEGAFIVAYKGGKKINIQK